MTQGDNLHFLAPIEDGQVLKNGDSLRIKINATTSAVLAFISHELAMGYASRFGFVTAVLQLNELAAGVMDSMPLLVFHSLEEIAIAYADRDAYDFSVHVEPWPGEPPSSALGRTLTPGGT